MYWQTCLFSSVYVFFKFVIDGVNTVYGFIYLSEYYVAKTDLYWITYHHTIVPKL